MFSRILIFFSIFFFSAPLFAQDYDKIQIETTLVRDNIYMLKGSGGNIGVCTGEDCVFLVDDQFAPLHKKIVKAVQKISSEKIRFVINTHWHYDHTQGNELMGKLGAVIVAHENARSMMSGSHFMKYFKRHAAAVGADGLPVITFTEGITFHLNKETIKALHQPGAHTSGDCVIFFEKANVVHMGDLYFNGFYPFIDTQYGGSLAGVIQAADEVLSKINDETLIIPGHGSLSNKKELQAYRDVLQDIYSKLKPMADAGKTLLEVVETKPTASYDETWGKGFLKPDIFVQIAYEGMTGKAQE